MIRVRISDEPYLHIPESLSKQLELAEDDRVEVVRSGHLITLRKPRAVSSPKPLRHLAGLVKSSRPRASVDVAEYMTCKGYEALHGQQDSQIR